MHPWRVHPDHRVRLADRHSGGDPEEVPEPHLLHPLLPKPLHVLALGGHGRGLPGHPAVHGGVEQRAGGSAATRRQGEEGRVKKTGLERDHCVGVCHGLKRLVMVHYHAAIFIQ